MATPAKIELLAPARDLETGRVAVDCGADAVYIGGPGFGARHAAGNSVEDVAALVRYARPFGVRVYAALNTLLFDSELAEAERTARKLIAAGVDALIVQDMAYLRMGLTGTEFHASTQTSNILPEDVAFLGRAGFRRVILERALSLDEIRAVRAACTDGTELEAFVHGAICVGYSGKCFMSRSTGPRSGNRGDCSQPCRLAWDLVDAGGKILIKGRHLLSVSDLDLSARIGELLDAGVTSFKIEGRLKDASYVRNTVSYYRGVIDEAIRGREGLYRASAGISEPDFTPDPSKSFTRGAIGTGCTGEYFFDGARRGVISFDTPKAVGEYIGVIRETGCERTGNRYFTFTDKDGGLSAGDGVCFFVGGELRGTNINRIQAGRIYPNKMDGIVAGVEIYRNHDHAFHRLVERSRMERRIEVSVAVEMGSSHVAVKFTDETGLAVEIRRQGAFEAARDGAKMVSVLKNELSRSGDTIFRVGHIEIAGGDAVTMFIPVSILADMRRDGLARLLAKRERLLPERHPATEDMSVQFPRSRLVAAENVTNRFAERFYRDHGVVEIEPALELLPSMDGRTVMRTRYCIRREAGECLNEDHNWQGDLFLERGRDRYRLGFDCAACEMTITKL